VNPKTVELFVVGCRNVRDEDKEDMKQELEYKPLKRRNPDCERKDGGTNCI
jgi:hypothetical protein